MLSLVLSLILFPLLSNTISHTQPDVPLPRRGIDFLGPLWLPRTFKITCCRGGTPVADNPKVISNWTESASDYAVDETSPPDDHCRVYEGSFLLSASALFNYSFSGHGVLCKCPSDAGVLDRHCRQLPPCVNAGYRSETLGGHCACTQPYFGELCEKTCDQGQTLNGVDGRSYCSCLPFYQGEECNDMVCLNGGVEMHGRCSCAPSFLGYHCEIDSNRTAQNRYQRFGEGQELFTRDISGTIFSLVMIIVLVLSMYLLMKHRMQVQSRFSTSREVPAVYGLPRRDIVAPFAVVDAPPPYLSRNNRETRPPREMLPPLPTYEDATKDLPLRTWQNSGLERRESSTPETRDSPDAVPSTSEEPSTPAPQTPQDSSSEPTISRQVDTRRSI